MGMFISPIQPMELGFDKTETGVSNQGGLPFQNILSQAIEQTNELTQISEQDGEALALGDVDNLAQIQINSMKATAMLQTTVQITTKVVNAYKEIMQMQI